MITEVAYLKEGGLVTSVGGEGGKDILKINLPMQEIEPRSPARMARVLTISLNGHWYEIE